MPPASFAEHSNNQSLLLLLLFCYPAGSQPAAWQSFVTIDDYDYDITAFAKQHPGGGVIKHYARMDASAAFTEFHRWGLPEGPLNPCITALLMVVVVAGM